MKTFFTAFGGAIIGTILGAVLLAFLAAAMIGGFVNSQLSSFQSDGSASGNTVLTLDLRDELSDQPATQGLGAIFGQKGFVNVLTRLDAARTDENVKGILIRASEYSVGSARAEELRDSILRLREAGKFVVVSSQGTYAGGPSALRAVAAADEIWVQPGGDYLPGGVVFETLFFKDLLDRLNVTAEIEQFYEYKNAPNIYKQTGYTEPHREAMTALADSLWTVSLEDIATDRGIELADLRNALTSGPLSPQAMIDAGIADRLGWPEDAIAAAKERAGENAQLLEILEYTPSSAPLGSKMIAVVGGEGPIVTGGASGDLINAGSAFASDMIANAILEAGRDDDVSAIVFRVDSPGGSPTASDQIWNAVETIQRETEKPIVVSMGSVAASGGYYVSTGADWIMASRSTITGSIGIFGGKLAVAEGLRQIGVNAETVSVGGPFAGALSTLDGFTDEQRTMLTAWLERGYDRFIGLVAEGRGMSVQEVDDIARGRVWSGADALDVGLVDEIGGLMDAIAKARELAEIDEDTATRVKFYPIPQGGIPGLGPMSEASATDLQTLARLSAILDDERVQMLIEQGSMMQNAPIQARGPMMIEH
ncbi:signal peptide peptidase SppA [Henriciella marina]|uniref:Signal peptide peptidase SppA n=1 Tax=Henriciella marina TaxID=453851 RepID=A0ABT4LXC4_9PROT|nr:signal peptide peptidase SppA [Henriciella marina]MCZ4298778.1 signal peptide peptidase SppA [Henriciella marina]